MPLIDGPWTNSWADLHISLGEGNQGEVHKVKSRTDPERLGALKILKAQDSEERRTRVQIEANALKRLSGARGVARLWDTNADDFEKMEIPLYIVTEFIKGDRPGNPIPFDAAMDSVLQMLGTIEKCHSMGVCHRDIKPTNVIFRDGNPVDPVFIDFGLSFFTDSTDERVTSDGTRMGPRNWFWLPEMMPGAPGMTDERYDITHCLGMLLNCITGSKPRVIRDDEGKKPHQRPREAAAILNSAKDYSGALCAVFDRGFEYVAADRWPTATALIKALNEVRMGSKDDRDFENQIRQMATDAYGPAVRTRLAKLRRIDELLKSNLFKHIEAANRVTRVNEDSELMCHPPQISGSLADSNKASLQFVASNNSPRMGVMLSVSLSADAEFITGRVHLRRPDGKKGTVSHFTEPLVLRILDPELDNLVSEFAKKIVRTVLAELFECVKTP